MLLQAEQLAEMNNRLPSILEGKSQPKDAAEHLIFATLCRTKTQHRYADAARFFEEAFKAQPKLSHDLNAHHRYSAAGSAVLAGCGQGKDADKLGDKERARLREQARSWLVAELRAYRKVWDRAPQNRLAIAEQLRSWQADTDFAGVRGEKSLAKLPEAERCAWQQLWADVADMLTQVQAKAPVKKKPDTK